MNTNATLVLPNGSVHHISAGCWIGRSTSSQLVLDDVSVSRRHVLIHPQGEFEYWLVDLGSSNGTKLNNRPVIKPMLLKNEDQILVGGVPIVFRTVMKESSMDTMVGSTLVSVKISKLWLLVADIEGFTPLSQRLPPSELARTIGTWFAKTGSIVERCGGDIRKYLGDGWLACWFDEAGADRRVAKCLEALGCIRDESSPPFRLALHKGEVTSSGSIASADLGMMGPAVNYLFRIEKIAARASTPLIISGAAVTQIRNHLPCESMGFFELKGFEGNHELFRQAITERNT